MCFVDVVSLVYVWCHNFLRISFARLGFFIHSVRSGSIAFFCFHERFWFQSVVVIQRAVSAIWAFPAAHFSPSLINYAYEAP